MSSTLTSQSVGIIRYSGRCTREINGGGIGKAIFQSPEHAAAYMREQASLRPREWEKPQNVYRCPYFDHYHLTKRQVVMVSGMLVEEGNTASLRAASAKEEVKTPQGQFRKPNGEADVDAIVAAYRNGTKRKQIAEKSGLGYGTVCRVLQENGCGQFTKESKRKPVPVVRHVPVTLEEIATKRAEIETQLRKLEDDEARLIETTQLHVDWRLEAQTITLRRYNDALTIGAEDRAVLPQLKTAIEVLLGQCEVRA